MATVAGLLLAHDLIITSLIMDIDAISPGSRQRAFDKVAETLSDHLEKHPDAEAHKDALFIVGNWSEKLPVIELPDVVKYGPLTTALGSAEAASMRISVLLDELESLSPGIGQRVADRALSTMVEVQHEADQPHIRVAVQQLSEGQGKEKETTEPRL